MKTIIIQTLFDITNTDVVRQYKSFLVKDHPTINTKEEWNQAKQQQNNFDTIIQIISLRTQPTVLHAPTIKTIKFNGKKQKVWELRITVEFEDIYFNGVDELGLLIDDSEHVPMINKLTSKIEDNYLRPNKNIRFEYDI